MRLSRLGPRPAAILSLLLLALAPRPAFAGGLEDDVLAELNFARTRPMQYARELQRQAETASRGRGFSSFGYEDPGAVEEAIDFLMRQTPLPPLRPDPRLGAAARSQASGQGPSGAVGHRGPRGESLGQRLQRQGVWAGLAAENISYGYDDPRDVVRQLIVDSGVAGRGHRHNIFGRAFQVAGVSCGRHRVYGSMCVINFAGALVAR